MCSCFIDLLNELGKSGILSLFGNEINKVNKTGSRMLDSIYHMTLKLFCNHVFWV